MYDTPIRRILASVTTKTTGHARQLALRWLAEEHPDRYAVLYERAKRELLSPAANEPGHIDPTRLTDRTLYRTMETYEPRKVADAETAARVGEWRHRVFTRYDRGEIDAATACEMIRFRLRRPGVASARFYDLVKRWRSDRGWWTVAPTVAGPIIPHRFTDDERAAAFETMARRRDARVAAALHAVATRQAS